jgi:iron complex outermembrane receptor protein
VTFASPLVWTGVIVMLMGSWARAGKTEKTTVTRGRVRRSSAWLLTSTILCCSGVAIPATVLAQPAAPANAQSRAVQFSIPAQPLPAAVDAFIRATGWQVGYSSRIADGIMSRAVSGTMTPAQALQTLLAGTGINVRLMGQTTATLIARNTSAGSPPDGAIPLDAIDVQGDGTTGFVATQTVSGTKTQTPVVEIPQSISTVTREQMDTQNVQTLRQAIRYSPGVIAEPRGINSRLDYLYVRGFGPAGNQYLDGLRVLSGEFGFPQVDPYFMQQVDVLRGPSATLYGQSPPGGLINMVSKRPTDVPYRQVELQYGTFNTGQLGFDFSGPIDAEKKFLYRFTGLGFNSDTQVDNAQQQRVAIQPVVTWRPDASTSLTIIANYQNDPHGGFYNNLPAFGTALPNPNGVIPRSFNPGDPNYSKFSVVQTSVGYQFEHRFNEIFQLRQNVRYMHVDSDVKWLYGSGLLADKKTLFRYAYADQEGLDAVTTDTQAQADFRTGSIGHRVMVGFDTQQSDLLQRYGFNFGAPTINVFAPVYGAAIVNPLLGRIDAKQTQLGLYAQDQIKIDSFVLTLGARQDWFETKARDTGVVQDVPWDQHASYRAGLTYLFDNGVAPYVSYSESFQPTSATQGMTADKTPLKPTTGQQIEGGIKYQPPGVAALFTAAIFDIKQQNVTTKDPGNIAFVTQTGEVESRGFELEAKASLSQQFNVAAAYTYLDVTNTKSNTTAPGIYGGTFSTQGLWPVSIPRHAASIWTDYTFDTGPIAGVRLGGGVRYVGATFGDAANSFTVSPFAVVDAMASYDFGAKQPQFKGLLLSVNATNLFDKVYVSGCAASAACYYGAARTVMTKLSYRW